MSLGLSDRTLCFSVRYFYQLRGERARGVHNPGALGGQQSTFGDCHSFKIEEIKEGTNLSRLNRQSMMDFGKHTCSSYVSALSKFHTKYVVQPLNFLSTKYNLLESDMRLRWEGGVSVPSSSSPRPLGDVVDLSCDALAAEAALSRDPSRRKATLTRAYIRYLEEKTGQAGFEGGLLLSDDARHVTVTTAAAADVSVVDDDIQQLLCSLFPDNREFTIHDLAQDGDPWRPVKEYGRTVSRLLVTKTAPGRQRCKFGA